MGEGTVTDQDLEEIKRKLLKKILENPEKYKKQVELLRFKETFNVEKGTPLKCPACSSYQIWASLWRNKDDKTLFTCRRCKQVWRLELVSADLDEVIMKLKRRETI